MAKFEIGPHLIEIEDDVFLVRWRDHNPELGPLVQVYERLTRFIAERGYALALFDLRLAGIPGSELRRHAGQWGRQQKPETLVIASYGMSTPLRALMILINRALNLFQGPGPALTALFNTESEARAWLAVQRPRLAAATANKSSSIGRSS